MKLSDDHSAGFVVPEHNKTGAGAIYQRCETAASAGVSFGDLRGLEPRAELCLQRAADIKERREML